METSLIIKKSNKKTQAIIQSIKDRKKEVKEFVAAGGKVKDFQPKQKSLA